MQIINLHKAWKSRNRKIKNIVEIYMVGLFSF